MPATNMSSKYELSFIDLVVVAALVGAGHYLSSLLSDYHSAVSISAAINSANVGVTAAFGAVVYCAYRFFRPRSA